MNKLLTYGVQNGASDIHFRPGDPPTFRVGGMLRPIKGEKLGPTHTRQVALNVISNPAMQMQVDTLQEHDTSYMLAGVARFRVNVYRQRGTLAIALRSIPLKIPAFDELGVPPVVASFAELERGLVLVVGAAGNGKSSTLAALIGLINQTRRAHIVTVEDPIEFIHQDALSSVSQREVGIDTPGFAHALRAALRQDPDVILVGEIRDEETMDIGLKAAETGHLVLSTLHTPDVARTIGRVLALSGQSVQETRERFADNLKAIVAQRLIPAAEGGLCLAAEVLVVTGTARESLRKPEGNPSLKDIMERGSHPYMMQTFEMHLRELVKQGRVTVEDAKNAMT